MHAILFASLVVASSLRAAEPKSGSIQYAHYSDPTVSFDYPAGWTLSVMPSHGLGRRCEINIYRNRRWFGNPMQSSGWNDLQLVFINLHERAKLLESQGTHDDSIHSLSDYRREIGCTGTGPADKIYPPFFTDGVCERPLGEMKLSGAQTKGYLYQWRDRHVSADPAVNSVFHETDVVFVDPKDPQWIYRANYFGPGPEFDQYYPAFKRLATSMRLSPNAAEACGEEKKTPTPEGAASEAPAAGGGAVPLLR